MVRHKIVKQRINKEAWELKKFTANELLNKLNSYPNMDGRNRTNLQLTVHRLANFLKANPNIKYIPNEENVKRAGMWEWIGD
jgi:dihydroxyacetone kinase-like predicted kinase|tara:strand:+ start:92 stop:337 length:246 start_codon:yes stop_codon:yes gene_type:complete